MARRKDELDKWALVIKSALLEWGFTVTHDEAREGAALIRSLMNVRLKSQLPQTMREPTQTKG